MQIRSVGASGLRVSALGLGTMTWGRQTSPDDAVEQLALYLDAGGTLVDTAASYGDGAAESILGAALAGRSDRDEVVVSSKAGMGRRDPQTGRGVIDGSARSLLNTLDASLTRLRMDHVDLWQVHVWDPGVPLDETCAALDAAVASGRTRYIGVSNYNGWQVGSAAAWQRAWPGRAPLISNQVEYSLVRRAVEDEVVPACRHHGLGLLAWSPAAGGFLSGKYRGGVPSGSRGADERWQERFALYGDAHGLRIVDAVATAAEGLGVSPLTVALSWVRDRPAVSSVLVGARTPAQLKTALAAGTFDMPEQIRAALDDVSA